MLQLLDKKIKQMHEALGRTKNSDLSSITPEFGTDGTTYYCKLDFSHGISEIGLANLATLLITNIACIKDHLNDWCKSNGIQFDADSVINNNKNVAIIHDLWNIEKHGRLKSLTRSGFVPKLTDLRQVLAVSVPPGQTRRFSFKPNFQKRTAEIKEHDSASLAIMGIVVDETGKPRGEFLQICEGAVAAWESALRQVGVVVPPR